MASAHPTASHCRSGEKRSSVIRRVGPPPPTPSGDGAYACSAVGWRAVCHASCASERWCTCQPPLAVPTARRRLAPSFSVSWSKPSAVTAAAACSGPSGSCRRACRSHSLTHASSPPVATRPPRGATASARAAPLSPALASTLAGHPPGGRAAWPRATKRAAPCKGTWISSEARLPSTSPASACQLSAHSRGGAAASSRPLLRSKAPSPALSASATGSDARGSSVSTRHIRTAPSLPQLSSVAPPPSAGPATSALMGPSCAPCRLAAVTLPSSAAVPCLYWCRLPLSLPTVTEDASPHTASCAATFSRPASLSGTLLTSLARPAAAPLELAWCSTRKMRPKPLPTATNAAEPGAHGSEHRAAQDVAARVKGEQRDRSLVAPSEDEGPRQLLLRLRRIPHEDGRLVDHTLSSEGFLAARHHVPGLCWAPCGGDAQHVVLVRAEVALRVARHVVHHHHRRRWVDDRARRRPQCTAARVVPTEAVHPPQRQLVQRRARLVGGRVARREDSRSPRLERAQLLARRCCLLHKDVVIVVVVAAAAAWQARLLLPIEGATACLHVAVVVIIIRPLLLLLLLLLPRPSAPAAHAPDKGAEVLAPYAQDVAVVHTGVPLVGAARRGGAHSAVGTAEEAQLLLLVTGRHQLHRAGVAAAQRAHTRLRARASGVPICALAALAAAARRRGRFAQVHGLRFSRVKHALCGRPLRQRVRVGGQRGELLGRELLARIVPVSQLELGAVAAQARAVRAPAQLVDAAAVAPASGDGSVRWGSRSLGATHNVQPDGAVGHAHRQQPAVWR
eukprot:scaffold68863_cov61-Phaeocystis_antarctica.AAC.1